MRSTITISLPEKVRKEIDQVADMNGLSRSDIVRESVCDYLFVRQFRGLRKNLVAKATERGIYTDQDVFNQVS
ncbi:MAG: ribbon-helix-helix domain-containing protein [Kiritimatiellae bacterium]|nr:ribbon-helix-helix domain-containing protein [Kiritimatiellia bacterium]